MTDSEKLDAILALLTIPAYVGPVIAVPANNDPDVQILHFYGIKGDKTAAAGRKVTARPETGQLVNLSLIDKQKLTVVLDANGYATLTVIRGISYEVIVEGWESRFITITGSANAAFSTYCMDTSLTASYDFTIAKGTTFSDELTLNQASGVAMDLTGYTVTLDTLVAGLTATITGEATGKITLAIDAVASALLTVGTYLYTLDIAINGVVTRVLQGTITVTE